MKRKGAGKDATPVESEQQPGSPTRGSNNLIAAVIVAVGLIVGGFFVGGKGGAAQAAADAPAPAVEETATHGPVQDLEPITLNLADGRFLKVGLALQLAESDEGHGGGEELASAKALDVAISHLGSYSMDELGDPKTRELAKKKLSEQIAEAYTDPATHHPAVTKVYFTEFVMQ